MSSYWYTYIFYHKIQKCQKVIDFNEKELDDFLIQEPKYLEEIQQELLLKNYDCKLAIQALKNGDWNALKLFEKCQSK